MLIFPHKTTTLLYIYCISHPHFYRPTPEPAKTGILNTFRNALFSPVIKADEEDGVGVVHASKHSYASGTNHANSSRSSSGSGSRGSPNPSSQPSASTTPRNGSVGSASVCFPSITRPSGPTVSIPNPYGGKPPASPSPKSPSIVRKNVNQVQQQVQSPPRVVQRVTPPPVQQISVDDDDEEDVFNPYQFIYMLPPHAYVKIPNKICLPPKQEPKVCIVFACVAYSMKVFVYLFHTCSINFLWCWTWMRLWCTVV